ncbi:SHOCT domain-containing protein [Halosimplex amylolyticum]|uniref:SHOCT domain-containing protein n=1 Tax=Halosimplex amylolyticum TaxID=3396616 RepID=UPI003F56289C
MAETTDGTRLVVLVLAVLGALLVVPMFFVGFGMMGYGPMMGGLWGDGMRGGGAMGGWLFVVGIAMQLLFLAVLVGGAYLVYRAIAGSESGSDRAQEELRLAYARGDLTDEEYEQRRESLERDS